MPPSDLLAPALAIGAGLGLLQAIGVTILESKRGRRIFGSFDEVIAVVGVAGGTALLGFLYLQFLAPSLVPRSIPLIAGLIAVTLMLGSRFLIRTYRERARRHRQSERVLIYGAGESGEQIARQMVTGGDTEFYPVGFLDDDPTKASLRLYGIRVLGDGSQLENVLKGYNVTALLVAIGSIRSAQLLDLDRRCSALGVRVSVIPTTSEIIGGAVTLGDISEVSEEDLLGRNPVTTDEAGIHALLSGKRILITGAGGSIGSELARQIQRYEPAQVGYLDRDESALHALQLSLDGRALLDSESLILADIRDDPRIFGIFEDFRPDVVFHAAALKHLSLLERFPEEAHKTNVIGTKHVLDAAQNFDVGVFVNISTDKAADPTSALGRTKLQTERMTASVAAQRANPDLALNNSRYISVRFGNVIGSRGSVLSIFRHQIAHGGPVTVTSPEVSRYFMTISEAVHLVLQAAVLGRHGETLVLDMGEPVLISEVAQRLIERSGRDIPIVFTGLRPGEKLNEVLIAADEEVLEPPHPLISRIRPSAGDFK